MKTREFSNSDDVIDSRDVIARIEELEAIIEEDSDLDGDEQFDDDGKLIVEECTCGECGATWNDAIISGRTPAPSARCPFEGTHEERAELKILLALQEEAECYSEDWKYGSTLIRESYWVEYVQEMLQDIGDLPKDIPHYIEIDWDKTANNIRVDYTDVEFDGVTYLVR